MMIGILLFITAIVGSLWFMAHIGTEMVKYVTHSAEPEPKKRVGIYTEEKRQQEFKRIVVDPLTAQLHREDGPAVVTLHQEEVDPYIVESQQEMEQKTAEFDAQYREWERQQK